MKTKVIFRMFKGECLALFPELAGDGNPIHCLSYACQGQHASAHLPAVIRSSRPAMYCEFIGLYRELCRLGYGLQVISRTPRAALSQRQRQSSQ